MGLKRLVVNNNTENKFEKARRLKIIVSERHDKDGSGRMVNGVCFDAMLMQLRGLKYSPPLGLLRKTQRGLKKYLLVARGTRASALGPLGQRSENFIFFNPLAELINSTVYNQTL